MRDLWLTATQTVVIVAAVLYATGREPRWAAHLLRRQDHDVALTEDLQAQTASIKETMGDIGVYASDTQIRLQHMQTKLEELEGELAAGTADPAAVAALKEEVGALAALADSLIATIPDEHLPTVPPPVADDDDTPEEPETPVDEEPAPEPTPEPEPAPE